MHGRLPCPAPRSAPQVDAARALVSELRRWEAQQPPRQHAAASGGGPSPSPRLAVDATETLFDFYLQLAWVAAPQLERT